MDPPTGIEPAQHGWDLYYFRRMCAAGAVDCLQADVSRCGGIPEWLRVAAVAASYGLQVSGHCAPHLHRPRADRVALVRLHPNPAGGTIRPDPAAPGLGLVFKAVDAERYRVGSGWPMLAVEIRPVRRG